MLRLRRRGAGEFRRKRWVEFGLHFSRFSEMRRRRRRGTRSLRRWMKCREQLLLRFGQRVYREVRYLLQDVSFRI